MHFLSTYYSSYSSNDDLTGFFVCGVFLFFVAIIVWGLMSLSKDDINTNKQYPYDYSSKPPPNNLPKNLPKNDSYPTYKKPWKLFSWKDSQKSWLPKLPEAEKDDVYFLNNLNKIDIDFLMTFAGQILKQNKLPSGLVLPEPPDDCSWKVLDSKLVAVKKEKPL
jgi:hypothetical protein